MMQKSVFLAAGIALSLLGPLAAQAGGAPHMTVWKSPWCGCCAAWAHVMERAGYQVTVRESEDLSPIRRQAGVPQRMEGCHTATLGGYFLEGHVPPQAIARLLRERPRIAGLAVPGMPAGSPGMGDDQTARYDVYAVGRDGESQVYYRAGAR